MNIQIKNQIVNIAYLNKLCYKKENTSAVFFNFCLFLSEFIQI